MTPQDAVQALAGKKAPAMNAVFSKPPQGNEIPFYLIRHGATALNAQNGGVDRVRGWRNVPLSDKGQSEADKLGDKLADSGIKVLVHSDLDRTTDTAKAIADKTGAQMIPTPLLRPWNVGVYTGRNSNEVHPELVRLAMQDPNTSPPEGESFNSFKQRAFNGLRTALLAGKGQPLGVVTHHRVERLINAWLANGQPPDFSIDFKTMFSHGEDPATAKKVSVNGNTLGIK